MLLEFFQVCLAPSSARWMGTPSSTGLPGLSSIAGSREGSDLKECAVRVRPSCCSHMTHSSTDGCHLGRREPPDPSCAILSKIEGFGVICLRSSLPLLVQASGKRSAGFEGIQTFFGYWAHGSILQHQPIGQAVSRRGQFPVFNQKAGNTREFASVVRNQSEAALTGDGGDHQIVWPNRCPWQRSGWPGGDAVRRVRTGGRIRPSPGRAS